MDILGHIYLCLPRSDNALEDVLAHVGVDGGEGVVEQVHAAVAVHGAAKNCRLAKFRFRGCVYFPPRPEAESRNLGKYFPPIP